MVGLKIEFSRRKKIDIVPQPPALNGSRPLLTFDIPQTALVATLDTYHFMFFQLSTSFHYSTELFVCRIVE
jgi:hypothetical protein